LRALAAELGTDHRRAHRRARVIASEPELAERELGKLNAWSDAIVACLSLDPLMILGGERRV